MRKSLSDDPWRMAMDSLTHNLEEKGAPIVERLKQEAAGGADLWHWLLEETERVGHCHWGRCVAFEQVHAQAFEASWATDGAAASVAACPRPPPFPRPPPPVV